MNWYFALSESSIDRPDHEWRDMIRVAVHSAKQHTQLRPHMLYDGEESPFVAELRTAGVNVIRHRVGFYDALEQHGTHNPAYLSIASGAFLRFDIPLIETGEFALYTDCDVVFQCRPNFYTATKPVLFAASSQSSLNPATDMNSGVMLINVPAMRADYLALVEFTRSNLSLGLDQEILRVFYEGRYQPMDRSLNWKPYWGVNPLAQIIHFHGPKPTSARHMAVEIGPAIPADWKLLYLKNRDAYASYGALWEKLLADYMCNWQL